jgi:hypothetical protein
MTPRVCFRLAKAALLMLNEPSKSMSRTVLKALKLRSCAEQRKLPAAASRSASAVSHCPAGEPQQKSRVQRARIRTRRAINQDMNRLQRVHHALHHISARSRAANVAGNVRGPPPASPDGRRRLRNYVFAPADEDDVRAERGERLGYAEANAAAAAWEVQSHVTRLLHVWRGAHTRDDGDVACKERRGEHLGYAAGHL